MKTSYKSVPQALSKSPKKSPQRSSSPFARHQEEWNSRRQTIGERFAQFSNIVNVQKANQKLEELIKEQNLLFEKEKWHHSLQERALMQLQLDDVLCRQDLVTYSVNFAEIAQLEQLIPTMVREIRRRAAKIKPKNDTKELENTKAILDSLYLKGKKDQQPNTRLLLGLAYLAKTQVQRIQVDADFFADVNNFNSRQQLFRQFFVRNSPEDLKTFPDCSFIVD